MKYAWPLIAGVVLVALGCASEDDGDELGSNVGAGGDAGQADDSDDGDDSSESDQEDDAEGSEVSDPDDADPTSVPGNDPASDYEPDGGLFGGTAPTLTVGPTPTTAPMMPADDPGPTAANPLVECASAVGTGEDPRIDDFEDHDDLTLAVDNREGGWYTYGDDSGATQSLEWPEMAGATKESAGVLHVVSDGFEQYSGIGFGLRWTESGAEHCYYDASYYDGMQFWVRGNASVRLALQNPAVRPVDMGGTCPLDALCYDSHGYDFIATESWTSWRVSFQLMEQAGWGTPVGDFDPTQLFTVEFQFAGGAPYEVWIDDVGFYKNEDPSIDDAGSTPSEPMPDAAVPEPTDEPTEPTDEPTEPTDEPTEPMPQIDAGTSILDASLTLPDAGL